MSSAICSTLNYMSMLFSFFLSKYLSIMPTYGPYIELKNPVDNSTMLEHEPVPCIVSMS